MRGDGRKPFFVALGVVGSGCAGGGEATRTTGASSIIMLIGPDAPRPLPDRFDDEGREGLPSPGAERRIMAVQLPGCSRLAETQ